MAPRIRTGNWARSNFLRVGRLAPTGRLLTILSSRSRMSLAASSSLVPQEKEILTELDPSLELEETDSAPGTALKACSIFLEISFSTSSGPAPGYFVTTLKVG